MCVHICTFVCVVNVHASVHVYAQMCVCITISLSPDSHSLDLYISGCGITVLEGFFEVLPYSFLQKLPHFPLPQPCTSLPTSPHPPQYFTNLGKWALKLCSGGPGTPLVILSETGLLVQGPKNVISFRPYHFRDTQATR